MGFQSGGLWGIFTFFLYIFLIFQNAHNEHVSSLPGKCVCKQNQRGKRSGTTSGRGPSRAVGAPASQAVPAGSSCPDLRGPALQGRSSFSPRGVTASRQHQGRDLRTGKPGPDSRTLPRPRQIALVLGQPPPHPAPPPGPGELPSHRLPPDGPSTEAADSRCSVDGNCVREGGLFTHPRRSSCTRPQREKISGRFHSEGAFLERSRLTPRGPTATRVLEATCPRAAADGINTRGSGPSPASAPASRAPAPPGRQPSAAPARPGQTPGPGPQGSGGDLEPRSPRPALARPRAWGAGCQPPGPARAPGPGEVMGTPLACPRRFAPSRSLEQKSPRRARASRGSQAESNVRRGRRTSPGRQARRRTVGPSAGSGSRASTAAGTAEQPRLQKVSQQRGQPNSSSEDIDQASELMGKARPGARCWGCGFISPAQKGRSWKPRGRPSSARAATREGGVGAHGARCQHLCSQKGVWGRIRRLLKLTRVISYLPRSPGRQKQVKARTRKRSKADRSRWNVRTFNHS